MTWSRLAVVLVMTANLAYISPAAHIPATPAQQLPSSSRAESAGPGVKTFPTKLPGVRRAVTSTAQTNHYEYVFTDGTFYVYDLDAAGFPLVKSKSIPTSSGTRGAVACSGNATLYVSFGGDGDGTGNGGLFAYDLVTDTVVWTQNYSHGIDSHAITSDCTRIYMPDGELSSTTIWHVVDAKTGNEIGTIAGSLASNPHNTIVFNGHVYLGGRQSTLFQAANVSNNTVYFTSANTANTIRPFTLNAEETAAYITETSFLGFQQIDLKTGAVRFTVPVAGFPTSCSVNCPSTPSHGISMSPDEKWLYVLDSINSYVHVFDISGGVNVQPQQKFDVKLNHTLLNFESPCAYDCLGDGWLHHSFDGRYVFVGDSGDVIDTGIQSGYVNPPTVVGFLPQMANSRKEIEIDFQSGSVVAAMTNRSSIGTALVKRIGLFNPATSTWFLRNSNTPGVADVTFGYGPAPSPWKALAGNWAGPRPTTVGLYDPVASTFYLRNSTTSGVADITFGYGPAGSGWLPIVGDWNGSGSVKVGLYNPFASTFFLRNSNTTGIADLTFSYGPGGLGWIPIVGDWTGKGYDSVGLYDPTTSTFYLRNSNTSGVADMTFGYGPAGAGWLPLVGDWTGNGFDSVGLYNPATSTFYLRNSNTTGFADLTIGYGPAGAGWTPVVGDWNGL